MKFGQQQDSESATSTLNNAFFGVQNQQSLDTLIVGGPRNQQKIYALHNAIVAIGFTSFLKTVWQKKVKMG
jgi:hypothetical protein